MKKVVTLIPILLISLVSLAQQEVMLINKTDCPVYFALVAKDNSCSTNTFEISLTVPPTTDAYQTPPTGFEFVDAKATQMNISQSCNDGVMYVSKPASCSPCSPTFPTDDSIFSPNPCACDSSLYMRWYTNNCGDPEFYENQIAVFH